MTGGAHAILGESKEAILLRRACLKSKWGKAESGNFPCLARLTERQIDAVTSDRRMVSVLQCIDAMECQSRRSSPDCNVAMFHHYSPHFVRSSAASSRANLRKRTAPIVHTRRFIGGEQIGEAIAIGHGSSFGVVKDDADRMPFAGPDFADAMTKVDTICASRAAHGAMRDGKHHGVALPQRNDHCA